MLGRVVGDFGCAATVVAAAGNEGPEAGTVGSPGNLPTIITVGAVTDSWTPETRDDDYVPDFSSQGPTPTGLLIELDPRPGPRRQAQGAVPGHK